MKEIHAYRNEDGTYKLEVVGEYYDHGELKEAHVVFESVNIKSDSLYLNLSGELFRVEIAE